MKIKKNSSIKATGEQEDRGPRALGNGEAGSLWQILRVPVLHGLPGTRGSAGRHRGARY